MPSDAIAEAIKIVLSTDDEDDGDRLAVQIFVVRSAAAAAAELLEARPRLAKWTRVRLSTIQGVEIWMPPRTRVRRRTR